MPKYDIYPPFIVLYALLVRILSSINRFWKSLSHAVSSGEFLPIHSDIEFCHDFSADFGDDQ